jgi:hypothetical protein
MWSANGRKIVCGSDTTGCTDTTPLPSRCDESSEIGPTKCEDNSRADNLGGMLK